MSQVPTGGWEGQTAGLDKLEKKLSPARAGYGTTIPLTSSP